MPAGAARTGLQYPGPHPVGGGQYFSATVQATWLTTPERHAGHVPMTRISLQSKIFLLANAFFLSGSNSG